MTQEYLKYVCPQCGYKFRFRVNTKKVLRCPNCASKNVVQDKFDLNRLVDKL
ncbi:MAG: hypothetical protein ACQESF_00530 [Nanobdellota archaeon]